MTHTCETCNVPTTAHGVHGRIGHTVVEILPASTLKGHKLRNVTTDRERSVGTLRTVRCSCTATQYTADGLERAVELHDSEAVARESRRARQAAREIRNAAVLTARYAGGDDSSELFPVETVVDATGEILRLARVHGDSGRATYVACSGSTPAVCLSLVDALELDALVWTLEAAQGRAQLAADAAPLEEILPPSDDVDAASAIVERIERTVETIGTRGKLWDARPTSTDYRDVHPDEYAARTDYPCHVCGVAYGH